MIIREDDTGKYGLCGGHVIRPEPTPHTYVTSGNWKGPTEFEAGQKVRARQIRHSPNFVVTDGSREEVWHSYGLRSWHDMADDQLQEMLDDAEQYVNSQEGEVMLVALGEKLRKIEEDAKYAFRPSQTLSPYFSKRYKEMCDERDEVYRRLELARVADKNHGSEETRAAVEAAQKALSDWDSDNEEEYMALYGLLRW